MQSQNYIIIPIYAEKASHRQAPFVGGLVSRTGDGFPVLWTGSVFQPGIPVPSALQCLMVLPRLGVWLSGGDELCVWSRKLDLLCKAAQLSDAGSRD